MTVSLWWLFITSVALISATPGPNMLLAFQYGILYGARKTAYTLIGLSLGLLLLMGLSAVGVSALSRQAPNLFEWLKAAGALYLAYLGWQSWRAGGDGFHTHTVRVMPTRRRLFRAGMAVSLSNPKAILFFAAFFPKFINHHAPLLPQYGILMGSFFVIETVWQLIYVFAGRSLAAWLQQGQRLRHLNRCCAAVFWLIATTLLWESGHHLLQY